MILRLRQDTAETNCAPKRIYTSSVKSRRINFSDYAPFLPRLCAKTKKKWRHFSQIYAPQSSHFSPEEGVSSQLLPTISALTQFCLLRKVCISSLWNDNLPRKGKIARQSAA
ncbi:DUF1661 domain-containing protein [Porphyromonas loveana]|uniref:DUF1661 domain-containing protein n=1 Tax=Porphyromonas loveana TaxID=1884669 RepID=UPI000E31C540